MPLWKTPDDRTDRVEVLLFERFSNHCLANTVEPLRAANDVLGRHAYEWRFLTPDGAPVSSSSDLSVMPAAALADARGGDALVVMPSYDYRAHSTAALRRDLTRVAGRFGTLIGMDTGAWPLAAAGLLDGRRATIHPSELDVFAERFGQVHAVPDRWVQDGDRLTAGGAMTAFELVLHRVRHRHGAALALEIECLFLNRDAPLPVTGGTRVRRALAHMENTVETPLPIGAIAAGVGCSQRRLEHDFAACFGASPSVVYRRLRLAAARRWVEDGEMGVAEIAVRSGYANASAFTRAFRREYGRAPRFLVDRPPRPEGRTSCIADDRAPRP